jgi:hypothetical protein
MTLANGFLNALRNIANLAKADAIGGLVRPSDSSSLLKVFCITGRAWNSHPCCSLENLENAWPAAFSD